MGDRHLGVRRRRRGGAVVAAVSPVAALGFGSQRDGSLARGQRDFAVPLELGPPELGPPTRSEIFPLSVCATGSVGFA